MLNPHNSSEISMCRTAVSALLLALLFLPAVRADEPKVESLKEFVKKNETRHAVGVYLQGKKVGWMVVELKLGTRNGKDVAIETSEIHLSLRADDENTSTSQKETTY